MDGEIAGKGHKKAHRPMTKATTKTNTTVITVSYARGKRQCVENAAPASVV